MNLTLQYSGTTGTCNSITIGSIALVLFSCDNFYCDSCSLSTSCSCSAGKYLSNANTCISCPIGCGQCAMVGGNVLCSQCGSVGMTNYYLLGTNCIMTCPVGTYGGADLNGKPTCVACDPPCATCSGSGTSACLSCSTGQLAYGGSTCGSCAGNTFANTASTCALCDANCLTCSVTSTRCLTCGLISFAQSYLYTDNVCYTTCPAGSYGVLNTMTGNHICTSCPTGCSQCADVSGSVQCNLCMSVMGLQYFLKGITCTSNCGSGYYGGYDSITSQPTCIGCVAPCANCNSASFCTSCSTGYLLGGICYTNCPFGYYISGAICAQCDGNCASCVTTSSKCLSCGLITGLQSYLHVDNSCYTSCPTGTYASSTNGVFLCVSCPVGCSICSLVVGSLQCT